MLLKTKSATVTAHAELSTSSATARGYGVRAMYRASSASCARAPAVGEGVGEAVVGWKRSGSDAATAKVHAAARSKLAGGSARSMAAAAALPAMAPSTLPAPMLP